MNDHDPYKYWTESTFRTRIALMEETAARREASGKSAEYERRCIVSYREQLRQREHADAGSAGCTCDQSTSEFHVTPPDDIRKCRIESLCDFCARQLRDEHHYSVVPDSDRRTIPL